MREVTCFNVTLYFNTPYLGINPQYMHGSRNSRGQFNEARIQCSPLRCHIRCFALPFIADGQCTFVLEIHTKFNRCISEVIVCFLFH